MDLGRLIREPKLEACILCLKSVKGNISIGPMACDSLKKHKFPVCTDCISCLKTPRLICRYCVVKQDKYFTFGQPLNNNIFNNGILSLKISLNHLDQQRLFPDPENSAREASFILKPFLFESDMDLSEGLFEYAEHFLPGMSVIVQDTKHLFTGGFNPETGTSTLGCHLVKYELDGRFKNFKILCGSSLVKRRHGHCSFYSPEQGKGWVFGGVSVPNPGEMEFLTSVESFLLDDMDMKLDDSWDGMDWRTEKKLQLKIPRTGASLFSSGQKVFLVGGYSDIGRPEPSIEVFDLLNLKSTVLQLGIPADLSTEVHLIELSNQSVLAITKDRRTFEIDFKENIILGKDQFLLEGLESWTKPHKFYSARVRDKTIVWGGSVFYKESEPSPENGFKYGVLDEEKKVIRFFDVFGGIKDLDIEVFSNVFGDIYEGQEFNFQKRNVN